MELSRLYANVIALVIAFVVMVGCSQETSESHPQPSAETPGAGEKAGEAATSKIPEPVTLSVLNGNNINEQDFAMMLTEPLQRKYPHITVVKTSNNNIDSLVTSGEIPDIIFTHNGDLGRFSERDLLIDLKDLAKKQQIEVGKFHPTIMQALAFESPDQLNAIPYSIQFGALYYNLDLFDRFGVAYPRDGMTWDEAIELGKSLSRLQDGVAIRGFDPYGFTRYQRLLGNSFYDPVSNKATLNTPEWRTIFELHKRILDIPHNGWTDEEIKNGISSFANFLTKRISAMYVASNMLPQLKEPSETGLRWDVAQHPSLPQRPNVYTDVDAHLGFVTSTSKHKDEAMLVLAVMTSEEVQLAMTRSSGRVSPLQDSKFKAAMAADMPHVQGKRLASIFKSDLALSPMRPKHFGEAGKTVIAAFYDFYTNHKDVNTVLREADEKLNKYLETELLK